MPNALDGMGDLNPTITPVLDLSRVAEGARGLNSMMALASLTPDVSNVQARILAASTEVNTIGTDEVEPAPTNLTFIQNNNSPKALSTNDIFRQTRSQIATAKEKLNTP
jgi:chemotaxis signal transduction protein